VFFVQALAYYRNNSTLSEERIQFPIQIIAAGYMLAAISKLSEAGLHWVTDSPRISLQILKGYSYTYFNTGDITAYKLGMARAAFITQHKAMVEIVCGISLFLELFAWIAVKNKRTAFVYGLLLLAMHVGIFYFLNVFIGAVFYPMLVFMVNPLYLLYRFVNALYRVLKVYIP
jgi:hypothetical protein